MLLRFFSKSRLVLLFGLLFFVFNINAAVTVDNTTSNGAFNAAGVAGLTWSHQVGNGDGKALFVGVSTSTTTLPIGVPTDRVASVTFNGVPLTRVGIVVSSDFLNTTEIFRLVNPQNGNHPVVVTLAAVPVVGNPFVNYVVGGAISLHGVNQAVPNGSFFSSTGNSNMPTVIVTDSVSGDLVLDTLAVSPNALFVAPDPNQTERWDGQAFFGNSFDVGAGSTEPGTSPSVTMSWLTTNPSNWALGAIAVKAAPPVTAAAVSVSGRVLSNRGRGVSRARVKLTNVITNETQYAVTNPFGYYRFNDISIGASYIVEVLHKQFRFAPQVITVTEEVEELNFSTRF